MGLTVAVTKTLLPRSLYTSAICPSHRLVPPACHLYGLVKDALTVNRACGLSAFPSKEPGLPQCQSACLPGLTFRTLQG